MFSPTGNGLELDDKKTSEEEFSSKFPVLITGLPESGWTESDVIKLCQPFGAPADIILARKLGKVSVKVSHTLQGRVYLKTECSY